MRVPLWLKLVVIVGALAGPLVVLAASIEQAIVYPAPLDVTPIGPAHGETLALKDARGRAVTATLRRASAEAPCAVLFHGNAEQVGDYGQVVEALVREGLSVAMVEYPGYGLAQASGPPSEAALYDAGEAVLAALRTEHGIPATSTLIVGRSLGTAIAAERARRGHGRALALLSPFTSVPAMAARKVSRLVPGALLSHRYDTLGKAPSLGLPVLVIHGEEDAVTPVSMGRELVAALPQGEGRYFADMTHDDVWREDARAALVAFARKLFPGRVVPADVAAPKGGPASGS